MMKWIVAFMMVAAGSPAFSKEVRCPFEEGQTEALLHIGYGNGFLLTDEPWLALECFQKASSFIDKSDPSSISIKFILYFSQIVAYDYVGQHDQCKQSIGSLFLLASEYVDDDCDEDESATEEDEDSALVVQFLKSIAVLAPSKDVRNLLLSFIEEVDEELLPPLVQQG